MSSGISWPTSPGTHEPAGPATISARRWFNSAATTKQPARLPRLAMTTPSWPVNHCSAPAKPVTWRASLTRPRQRLDDFSAKFPDDALNAYALPYRGEIALAEERPTEAAQLFQVALERFPSGPLADDCRLGLARASQLHGNSEEARRRLADLIVRDGRRTADAHYRLGTLEYAAREYERAEAAFAAARERAGATPLADKAQLARGRAQYQLHRFEAAVSTLEPLRENETLAGEAHYWLGLSHKALQHWDDSARELAATVSATGTPERQTAAPR